MEPLTPQSIRPNPNTRHENVTKTSLDENGARIIAAKREIERLEHSRLVTITHHHELAEWRRTLRMLQAERKALRRAAQMRLF